MSKKDSSFTSGLLAITVLLKNDMAHTLLIYCQYQSSLLVYCPMISRVWVYFYIYFLFVYAVPIHQERKVKHPVYSLYILAMAFPVRLGCIQNHNPLFPSVWSMTLVPILSFVTSCLFVCKVPGSVPGVSI